MSTSLDLSGAQWVKSSYSGNGGGSCVEWAPAHASAGHVPVRDSKNPHAQALTFTITAWTSFVKAVRAGAFDQDI